VSRDDDHLFEALRAGASGYLLKDTHPARLAAALRALCADPARRRRLGAAGARRARERYGWQRVAGATLEVYQSVVAGARRGTNRRDELGVRAAARAQRRRRVRA
jgi:glycosyltransferase involved in cell wall biosynthesis